MQPPHSSSAQFSSGHSSSAHSSSAGSAPLVVRGPAALAAALPYLLDGARPGSLVLAAVSERRRLQSLIARRLPVFPAAASSEVQGRWAEDVSLLLEGGLNGLALLPDEHAAAVLYLEGVARPPAPLQARLHRRARTTELGCRLLDVVAVFEGRWRSMLCTQASCCPADGVPLLEDPAAIEMQAELIAAAEAGQLTFAEAAQTAQTATSGTADAEGDLDAALTQVAFPRTFTDRRSLLRLVWPVVQSPTDDVPALSIAALLVAAACPGVRDALLTRMVRKSRRTPRSAPRDGMHRANWWSSQEELWRRVLRPAPLPLTAGPATMAAVSAWAQQDARSALQHLKHALTAEPDHRMALLLRRLIEQGGSAAEWFQRVASLDERDCLRFDRAPHPGGRRAAG